MLSSLRRTTRTKLFVALSLILFSLDFCPTIKTASALPLPIAPDTGTPKGNSTPGTTRAPEDPCPHAAKPLTALVANNGKDFTLAAHPNFWFYIPYSRDHIHSLEFLLLDGEESETIYETEVELIDNSGIIKITLPQKTEYALQVGRQYRWYFLVNCEENANLEPDLAIDGWVERITPTPELTSQLELNKNSTYLVYERHQIWFDAIDSLASAYFSSPDRPHLKTAWTKLWQNLQYQWLIPETFAASRNYNNPDILENKGKIKHFSLDRLQN
jgi:hypothetical protein